MRNMNGIMTWCTKNVTICAFCDLWTKIVDQNTPNGIMVKNWFGINWSVPLYSKIQMRKKMDKTFEWLQVKKKVKLNTKYNFY